MEKWSKSVAIVTGANCGNGFGILKKFAAAGITVVGFDVNIDLIEKFKSENSKLRVFSRVCDVTDNDQTESAFKWVEDKFGGVDILVNNAGTLKNVGILEHKKSMSELAFNIDLNITAVVRCARLAFKSMEARNAYGYIMNINSVYGHGLPPLASGAQLGVYPSTKYAITAATEVMRGELLALKNRKVRVTSISPGVVKTGIFKASEMSKEMEEEILSAPFLLPEDIGDTLAYLLLVPYHISIHEITVRATGSEV